MQRLGNDRKGSQLTRYPIDTKVTLTHLKYRDIPAQMLNFSNCTSLGSFFLDCTSFAQCHCGDKLLYYKGELLYEF